MHFASFLGLACLTASTFAAPVQQAPKDFSAVDKAFKNIMNNLKGLTVAIKDLDNSSRRGQDTSKQEIDVERRGNDVTAALRDGTGRVRQSSMLTTVEATATVGPIEQLGAATQGTVDAWIQAKPSILRAGGRQPVLKILAAQETATDEFVDAVNAKMPLVSITAARIYGQKARSQVDQAIAVYNRP